LDGDDHAGRLSSEAMRRRIKVLFFVSHPTLTPAISVHANLMRHLNPERVEVHAVYPKIAAQPAYIASGRSSFAALPQSPEVRLRALEFGPAGDASKLQLLAGSARAAGPALWDAASLIRFIARERIDVIHCEEGTRNAFYAHLLARVTRARSIVHYHLGYGDWMSRSSRLAIRRAEAIIAVSSWTGREIHKDGVPAERIFPVLNGIDVSRWDPAGADGTAIRREFGLGVQDPLIVQVAQLVAWKRQHLVLEALPRVLERHPTARLLLVGAETAAHAGDGTYTAELERRVAAAGLEQNVVLTGQRRDVREILAAADVFVLPSVGEPCGLASLEAMAMEKPVVSVRAGGTPEVVEHGKAGLLGEPDDAEELAANLLALLDAPERRRTLGEYGRRRVLEHFTVQRMADDVEAVYRLVAARP
jgi:glycosyltransferase involved in cell wall biosynthesis